MASPSARKTRRTASAPRASRAAAISCSSSSVGLGLKRFCRYMLQKVQRLCAQPRVTCRIRDSASLGGRKSGMS